LLLTQFGDPFFGAETWVGVSAIDELGNTFPVVIQSFTLPIGLMGATPFWAFIPVEAEPVER